MEVHYGSLRDVIGEGANNEAILDAILSAPSEQLIPWEECTLPSQGIYYGWPDGVCQVKPMGQVAEKIMATQRLAASGQSIDYLFRECCRFPAGFDPSEMLLGDRVFLLYYLRGITHGNLYEFMFTCPNSDCGATTTHTYDLNDLAATIKPADPSLGEEPFRVSLPYLSQATGRDVWVGLRFLRAYDTYDMLASKRTKKKITGRGGIRSKMSQTIQQQQQQQVVLDSTLDENLEKTIVSVMGVTDRFKIRNLVQKLHAQDTATIREWLKENTPGIDTTVELVCPECGEEFTVGLPITEGFFRPAKR
jgi:hypothetical protein